jgi:pimeloyl-ACP methyl ester carboxylesterase
MGIGEQRKPLINSRQKPLKYWLKLIAFGLVFAYLLLNIGLAYVAASAQIRPARSDICCETPADFGAEYEEINLPTHDGLRLAGWYIPSHNQAAIILVHGYGSNRLGVMLEAEALFQQGYGVLMYDQRASGESEGETLSWGWRDVDDVEAVIQFLYRRGDVDSRRIGIMGCSTGAEIAIAAAAQQDALRAVAADAPYYTVASDMPPPYALEDWLALPMYPMFIQFMEWKSGASASMSLSQAVTYISPRPILLISTGQDFELRQVQRYYDLAGGPKQHWNIPEAQHCSGIQVRPEEYANRISKFFEEGLLGP